MSVKAGMPLPPLRLLSLHSHVVLPQHARNAMCRIVGCGRTASRITSGPDGRSYAYCNYHEKRHDAELPEICCVASCNQLSTNAERVSWAEGVRKYCSDHSIAHNRQ